VDKKKHKIKGNKDLIAQESICGYWIQRDNLTRYWKDVTCKRCLKRIAFFRKRFRS